MAPPSMVPHSSVDGVSSLEMSFTQKDLVVPEPTSRSGALGLATFGSVRPPGLLTDPPRFPSCTRTRSCTVPGARRVQWVRQVRLVGRTRSGGGIGEMEYMGWGGFALACLVAEIARHLRGIDVPAVAACPWVRLCIQVSCGHPWRKSNRV
ncbi:hypothetical protein AG1IA_09666 [Rhizoctonia solani AG-1 IA]|uniref:Uncharacterized protein n=1 Tax=Thanatephorus cucumeris (strain AG1-IA) TaxID=983506 RepID=L8WIY9_THACA|nr:hypothetical protein AG1IA_09666 [Rhizoctonia solani AG-1 IA]